MKKAKIPPLSPLPAPNDKMKEVLMRTVEEAKALISKVSIIFFLNTIFHIVFYSKGQNFELNTSFSSFFRNKSKLMFVSPWR